MASPFSVPGVESRTGSGVCALLLPGYVKLPREDSLAATGYEETTSDRSCIIG